MEENLKKLSGHVNDYLVQGYPINEKTAGTKAAGSIDTRDGTRIF